VWIDVRGVPTRVDLYDLVIGRETGRPQLHEEHIRAMGLRADQAAYLWHQFRLYESGLGRGAAGVAPNVPPSQASPIAPDVLRMYALVESWDAVESGRLPIAVKRQLASDLIADRGRWAAGSKDPDAVVRRLRYLIDRRD
jgi:hypothetical protein